MPTVTVTAALVALSLSCPQMNHVTAAPALPSPLRPDRAALSPVSQHALDSFWKALPRHEPGLKRRVQSTPCPSSLSCDSRFPLHSHVYVQLSGCLCVSMIGLGGGVDVFLLALRGKTAHGGGYGRVQGAPSNASFRFRALQLQASFNMS
jgi:hypothetical protein